VTTASSESSSVELTIPEAFADILSRDPSLHGGVILSLAEFEPWIRLSGTPFFPEYTDHGVVHIRDVMRTSSAIIRDSFDTSLTLFSGFPAFAPHILRFLCSSQCHFETASLSRSKHTT
jgi:hypothetical protein